jgi:hypothetical protein
MEPLFARAIAGGVAVYTGPSSPANKMIGIGLEGVPDPDSLSDVERRSSPGASPMWSPHPATWR